MERIIDSMMSTTLAIARSEFQEQERISSIEGIEVEMSREGQYGSERNQAIHQLRKQKTLKEQELRLLRERSDFEAQKMKTLETQLFEMNKSGWLTHQH